MISFRNRAPESTRRPNSFLGRRPSAATRLAALMVILLAAASAPAVPPRPDQRGAKPRAARPAAEPRSAQAQAEPGSAGATDDEGSIPVRVTRIETPDGPAIIATIGEFPADLNEAGQEFLQREFFEHFASDVLGLDDPEARATLKVAMLPQEKENQREGDFTSGKLSGHITVLVERRRVYVACTFSEAVQKPLPLAGTGRFAAGAFAAE